MPTKKERLEAMARQIAPIIIEDLEAHGTMKPSYLSPKFWHVVRQQVEELQENKMAKNDNPKKPRSARYSNLNRYISSVEDSDPKRGKALRNHAESVMQDVDEKMQELFDKGLLKNKGSDEDKK